MSNAVTALIAMYDDAATFTGASDVHVYLTTIGFNLSIKTAGKLDAEARRLMFLDGKQVQDPTWENNWSRTRLASQEEMERSRQRSIRYLRTFTTNLAQKLAVDAAQWGASPEAIQNNALLQTSVSFIQALSDYSFDH